MIKINKKVEYALMALKYMSESQSNNEETYLVSAREICDHFNTPFDTTAKVLQVMNNNGLLKSTKGIKGGYSLARALKDVTFLEMTSMIEGRSDSPSFCESSKGVCDLYDKCNIVTPMELLNRKIHLFLSSLTLEELLIKDSGSSKFLSGVAFERMENL
jgi:Rrf2 family protein